MYPRSRSFHHDPMFMVIGEGRNLDRPVNQVLHLSAQFSLYHKLTSAASTLLLHSPLTCEQDSEILELFNLIQELPSNLKRTSNPFPVKNSDLEELILIPASSYWAANRPSTCCTGVGQ
ncbi:hypothetical protein ILYODFUR_021798 [Ilyodon furcidens]|uniref:Uncharacterized protein n=1 Tax=Ilyodon furcidens TaxID=33524 RepID=A0ABV0SQF5_9TELE